MFKKIFLLFAVMNAQYMMCTKQRQRILPPMSTKQPPKIECSLLEGESCSICFEPMTKKDALTRLTCSHWLHAQCMIQWAAVKASQKARCPLCRGTTPIIYEQASLMVEEPTPPTIEEPAPLSRCDACRLCFPDCCSMLVCIAFSHAMREIVTHFCFRS